MPRPYRDQRARAIAGAAAIASTAGALEAILDLRDTRATTGAGAALPADVLDRLGAISDGGIEVAVTDGMAQADDHGGL